MNATLQCFYHCGKLTKYIINKTYLSDNIIVRNNTLTYEYIELINQLYNFDGKNYVEPYRFKDILGRKNPLFKGVAANDSKDLILYLQEVLAKELAIPDKNKINEEKKSPYINMDQTNESNVLNLFVKDFKKENSIIKDLFYFFCETESECLSCHNKIYNFQVSNFLIFPLEKTYKESRGNNISTQNNNNYKNMYNNLTNNMNNQMMIPWMNYLNNTMINNMNSQMMMNIMNTQNMTNNMNTQNMTNNINTQNMTNNINTQNMTNNINTQNMTNNMNNQSMTNNMNSQMMTNNMNNPMMMNNTKMMIDYYMQNLNGNNQMKNINNNYINNFSQNNNMINYKTNNKLSNIALNNLNFGTNNNLNNYTNIALNNLNIGTNNNLNNYSNKLLINNNYHNKLLLNDVKNNERYSEKNNKKNEIFTKSKTKNKSREKIKSFNNIFFNNDINNNNFHKNNNEQRLLLGSGPIGKSLLYPNSKPKLTLDQCFESYLKPEYFFGSNKQHCNKCHTLTEAYYTTYIYSSSHILIIILNYGKGILFECDVEFDEFLDISKYVKIKACPLKYRLLGAIVHFGPSSMSGHFIAFCRGIKDKENWYKLNDAEVSKATFQELKTIGMPYVLFYENTLPY